MFIYLQRLSDDLRRRQSNAHFPVGWFYHMKRGRIGGKRMVANTRTRTSITPSPVEPGGTASNYTLGSDSYPLDTSTQGRRRLQSIAQHNLLVLFYGNECHVPVSESRIANCIQEKTRRIETWLAFNATAKVHRWRVCSGIIIVVVVTLLPGLFGDVTCNMYPEWFVPSKMNDIQCFSQ